MNNPNGPYPGRQLFLGLTLDGKPCLTYLVTGRSPQSRERKAISMENIVIMGPIGQQQYDPLRHYTAIKYDNTTGLAVVSNGIQTEAIFEIYRLLSHTESTPEADYLAMVMNGARSEPDSLHTPRIAGVISNTAGKTNPTFIISIKIHGRPADTFQIKPRPGTMTGVSTYNGDMDNPKPFDVDKGLAELNFNEETAEKLARFIYDMSEVSYQRDDIRVCAISAIRSEGNLIWKIALINRHKS